MAKKPQPSPDSAATDLASAIHRLTDMLGIVDDTLRGIKGNITWIINNREEFPALQGAQLTQTGIERRLTVDKPEIIVCTDCDTDSPSSLASALQAGWSELAPHDGPGWNYIGLCPACLENEYTLDQIKPEERLREPNGGHHSDEPGKSQGTLY
jgi:hypothetical protein